MPSDAELLKAYLADRDVACPGCGYSLKGCEAEACPECNRAIRLALHQPGWIERSRLLFIWASSACSLYAIWTAGFGFWNLWRVIASFGGVARAPMPLLWNTLNPAGEFLAGVWFAISAIGLYRSKANSAGVGVWARRFLWGIALWHGIGLAVYAGLWVWYLVM